MSISQLKFKKCRLPDSVKSLSAAQNVYFETLKAAERRINSDLIYKSTTFIPNKRSEEGSERELRDKFN